ELGPAGMNMTRKSLSSRARAAYRGAVLKAAPVLTRRRMGHVALVMLRPLAGSRGDVAVIEQLYRTCSRLGMTERAAEYRAAILRGRATRAARAKGLDRPVVNLLRAMAALEGMVLASPLAASKRLSALMADDRGLAARVAATEPLIAEFPDSILVTYGRPVAPAKSDRIDEAVALVRGSTKAVTKNRALDPKDRTARLNHLRNVWRVVAAIARDKMAWAGGGEDAEAAVEGEAAKDKADEKDK